MVFAIIFLVLLSIGISKMVYDVQKSKKRKQNQYDEYYISEDIIENNHS